MDWWIPFCLIFGWILLKFLLWNYKYKCFVSSHSWCMSGFLLIFPIWSWSDKMHWRRMEREPNNLVIGSSYCFWKTTTEIFSVQGAWHFPSTLYIYMYIVTLRSSGIDMTLLTHPFTRFYMVFMYCWTCFRPENSFWMNIA
jgi:hypothetical protein